MLNYILNIGNFALIYIILAVSSHLLVRVANQISLGQAAFFGLGAYITALCTVVLDLPLIPSLIIVMTINGLLAYLIAIPSVKLKGDYFVIATLAFQFIVYSVLYNWKSVTGGSDGISGITFPNIFFAKIVSEQFVFFIINFILTIILMFLFFKLQYSMFGKILKALQDDEISLLAVGRDTKKFKISVFVISSAFIGWASYLYATYMTYIDPNSFNIHESIFILIAVLLGGTEKMRGAVLGALFMVLLPEILRFIQIPDMIAAALNQIILGVLLLVIVFFRGNRMFSIKEE